MARYWKKVSGHLRCSRKSQTIFHEDTVRLLKQYLEENPVCDETKLFEDLGTPQEYAEEFMAGITPKEVETAERFHKRRTGAILLLAAAVFCASIITAVYFAQKNGVTRIVIETTVYEDEIPSDLWPDDNAGTASSDAIEILPPDESDN